MAKLLIMEEEVVLGHHPLPPEGESRAGWYKHYVLFQYWVQSIPQGTHAITVWKKDDPIETITDIAELAQKLPIRKDAEVLIYYPLPPRRH